MVVECKDKMSAAKLIERAKIEGKATVWMCRDGSMFDESVKREFNGEHCLGNAIACLQNAIFSEIGTMKDGEIVFTDYYMRGRTEHCRKPRVIYGLVSIGDDIPDTGSDIKQTMKLYQDKSVNTVIKIFNNDKTLSQAMEKISHGEIKPESFMYSVNQYGRLGNVDKLIKDSDGLVPRQNISNEVKLNKYIKKAEELGKVHLFIEEIYNSEMGWDTFNIAARTFYGKNALKDAIKCAQIAVFNDVPFKLEKNQEKDKGTGYISKLMRGSRGLGIDRSFGSSEYDYECISKEVSIIVDDTYDKASDYACLRNMDLRNKTTITSCVDLFTQDIQDKLIESGDITNEFIDFAESVENFKASEEKDVKKVLSSDKFVNINQVVNVAEQISGEQSVNNDKSEVK